MKNKTAIIIMALLGLVLGLGFSPKDNAMNKEQALNTLNGLLDEDIQPVAQKQVKRLSKTAFNSWLKKSSFSAKSQKAIKEDLKPLTSAPTFSAVVLKNVKLKNGNPAPDVVLFAIPPGVRFRGWADSGIILWPIQEVATYCHFLKCINGRCLWIIRNNSNCPNDKCKSDADCDRLGDLPLENPIKDAIESF